MPIIEGKSYTYSQLEEISGVNHFTLYERVASAKRKGVELTFQELTRPSQKKNRIYVFDRNGNKHTLNEAAEILDADYEQLRTIYHERNARTLEALREGLKDKVKNYDLLYWGAPDWSKITYRDVKEAGRYSRDMDRETHLNITCDLLGINRRYARDLVDRFGDF